MKAVKFKPELDLDRNSIIPLRAQITEQLRKDIIRYRLPVGTKLISERQLADKLKINRNTVHQAYEQLANDGLLEPSRLRGGGMMIAPAAPNHYRAPFPSLNLILPYRFSEQLKLTSQHGLEIIAGIMDRAAELHISVNITALPDATLPKPDIESWLEMFIPRSIGIITLGLRSGDFDPVFEELLHRKTIPHVFVSGTSPLPHISSVVPTDQGVREMLDCLKRFGHRRLGVAAVSPLRQSQFLNCANDRGLTIARLAAEYGMATTYAAIDMRQSMSPNGIDTLTDQLLNVTPRPTAIWVQNDEFAEQFKQKLVVRGIRVPEDISLAGYDNIRSHDELSTIDHSRFDIGSQSVDIIAELFERPALGVALHRTVPSHFVLKNSISHAKESNKEVAYKREKTFTLVECVSG